LNDAEFPPLSGTNVAFDAAGPITLLFTTPVSAFSGFFTYAEPLTLTAFSASDQVLGTATSLFAQNFASSGNATNELLQFSFSGGIDHVTIAGDPGGASFVIDDVTYVQTTPVPVPEPNTLVLFGFGAVLLTALRTLLASNGPRGWLKV